MVGKKAMEILLKLNLKMELVDSILMPPYVILKNKRYTLAVKYVRKGDALKGTADFLIKEIEAIGFKIKTLFLIKNFTQ